MKKEKEKEKGNNYNKKRYNKIDNKINKGQIQIKVRIKIIQ